MNLKRAARYQRAGRVSLECDSLRDPEATVPALLDSLLVVPRPQRRRSLLFFDGFLDESDDLALFRYVVELCDGERKG